LRAREVDVGAIAAEEARVGIIALFAFEIGADTDDGDDDIGLASGGEGFVLEIGWNPEESGVRFAEAAEVLELDGIGVASLEMDGNGEGAFASLAVESPVIDEELAVEIEAETAVGGGTESVLAINGSDE